MTSTEAYYLLQAISEENSRNGKIDLLREFLYDELFKKIILYAYDPFKTYGVLFIPTVPFGTESFNDYTFYILDQLVLRKLTGNAAKETIKKELSRLDMESNKLFRAILEKNLDCGFNVKSINKAWDGLIKVFPYMRCSTYGDVNPVVLSWNHGVFSQVKADGMFANVSMTENGARLNTRSGQPFDLLELADLRNTFEDVLQEGSQYHGELRIVKPNGLYLDRQSGNGLLNSILKGGKLPEERKIDFVAWDSVPLKYIKEKGKYTVPYSRRLEFLKNMTKDSPIKIIPTRLVYSLDEAFEHFEEVISKGGEGTIIKDFNAIWQDGTSRAQIKLKKEKEMDLRVVDLIEGTGKNKDTFGSLLCVSDDGQIAVSVSGFTDEERKQIAENKDEWINSIVSIKYNELIKNKQSEGYSLYLPRFVEKRSDKDTTDTI